MTYEQFDAQINRLCATYGPKSYPDERVKILWREVKDYDAGWFEKTVDEFIATSERAPLIDKFRAAISLERERRWDRDKKQHREDARQFMCNPEYRDLAFGGIMKRLNGEMNDSAFEGFLGLLDNAATEIERGRRFELQKQLEQIKRDEGDVSP